MAQFKVWDAINAEESDAKVLEAYDAEEAATLFAEDDDDGQADGLYQSEHPICVRTVHSGELTTFQVQVEMVPSFVAVRSD